MQGNYENLKAAIAAVIYANGNNEITGTILQNTLHGIVNSIAAGATFAGVATPATNPSTLDNNCFFLATEAGTYANFNGYVLAAGYMAVFSNNSGSWVGSSMPLSTSAVIDAVPTDGSTNAVSSNGVYDALQEVSQRTFVRDSSPLTTYASAFNDLYMYNETITTASNPNVYKIYAIPVSAGDSVFLQFHSIPNADFGAVAFVDSLSKVVNGTDVDILIWGHQASYTDEDYQVTSNGYLLIQGTSAFQAFVSVYPNVPMPTKVSALDTDVNNIEARLGHKVVFELNENTDNYAGSYAMNALGIFSRTLAQDEYVNSLKVRLLKADAECDAEYRVYKRYTGAASTDRDNSSSLVLSTATLIDSGTIHITEQYADYDISIPKTLIAVGEQVYFLVCGLPTASKVEFKGWSVISDDDGVSNTVLLSTQSTLQAVWSNSFAFGMVGRYGAPSLSMYLKSEFMTQDDGKALADALEAEIQAISQEASNTTDIVINDSITAVVGDKLQIFYSSIFNVPNLQDFEVFAIGAVGKSYPRYYEITPTNANLGSHTITFYLGKCADAAVPKPDIIKSKAITLNIVAEPTTGAKNILLVGDSTIINGVFPKEVKRRFASTNGNPAGLGLTGINLCGRLTGSVDGLTCGWEGTGGWGWNTYTSAGVRAIRLIVTNVSTLNIGAQYIASNNTTLTIAEVNITAGSGNVRCTIGQNDTLPAAPLTLTKSSGSGDATIAVSSYTEENYSPFYNNGAMDFATYANTYCNGQIDILVACLGINDIYGHQNDTDISGTISGIINDVKTFARGFHDDFPSSKLAIMTDCRCSPIGGMGANYGASWGATNAPYDRCAYALNKAYIEMSQENEFSPYVLIFDASAEFDAEYSYPFADTPVNTRCATIEHLGTNGVHPLDEGLEMWADTIFREISAIL